MSNPDEIQNPSEELALPENQELPPVDGLDVDDQEDGFDIVLNDDEKPKQAPEVNAHFAQKRLERKRQREIEAQLKAIENGELPEAIRVNPDLPAQPSVDDFLSDEALSKYDYDTAKATAAYQGAIQDWQFKAMDARSNAVAAQGKRTQEYTQQSQEIANAMRAHYDSADKLNKPDYQEKEDVAMQILPNGLDAAIAQNFPDKSAAMIYFLGSNPEKAREIFSKDPVQITIALTRLSDNLTLKPRGKQRSEAPPADEPLNGSVSAANVASLQKQMNVASEKGDVAAYRAIKAKLQGLK